MRFEGLVDKLEAARGLFNLFALILTRRMETVLSTSGDSLEYAQNRWTVMAAAPWLGSGRLSDVRKLTEAIVDAGGEQLLENSISGVVVVPTTSELVKLLADVRGTTPEVVLTRGILLDCNVLPLIEQVAPALSDVLRVRVLRANPQSAETLS